MECRPYNIYVSVSYPPDTDTPGYKVEMESKPEMTKHISESGAVFTPKDVALDLINYSTKGYFGISSGLDGWLLKQLHPGTMRYFNGDVYEGKWDNNERKGEGVLTYADGSSYSGAWFGDVQHGKGRFTDTEGTVYAGKWVMGKVTKML
eukprot:gene40057-49533_t